MGIYSLVEDQRISADIRAIAKARKYTLYQRACDIWYVNFRADARQYRLATGCATKESARALVESFRTVSIKGPCVEINDKQLYVMIERSRHRAREKKMPFELTINSMRDLVRRSNGYCEVTGHQLEKTGPFRPSLDRINNAIGYVPSNIRLVCLITNTAMLQYGERSLLELSIAMCRTKGLLPTDHATPPTSPVADSELPGHSRSAEPSTPRD